VRARIWFLLLCIAALALAGGYIVWTRDSAAAGTIVTEPSTPNASATSPGSAARRETASLPEVEAHPFALYRDTSLGDAHGRVVFRALDAPLQRTTDLSCERVHFAAGHGVCLRAQRGFVTRYDAITFDASLGDEHTIVLAGVPSRVRVSPDGARAGITVFVAGDSYAPGRFSTRTTIIDVSAGTTIADLEQFTVRRDGVAFRSVDFNFWGLTFANKAKAYATLGTGGHTYLVEVDVDGKHATVLHENVECPSLSPDGTRVAFKKRSTDASRLAWRLHTLVLATGAETALAETRTVDDQPEWRDNSLVTYALPNDSKPGSTDVWGVSADGTGEPTKIFSAAWSPAFVASGK